MSELQRFLPHDQDLLVGLLYRVGLFISRADDTDVDTKSEEREEATLLEILAVVAASNKVALISEMAAEAVRQKNSWGRWVRSEDKLMDDVSTAVALLKIQGTEIECNAFNQVVMIVGMAVARAFREGQDHDADSGYLSWLTGKIKDIRLAMNDREAYRDMNISPAEDTALNNLYEVLTS